jgi:hypothetical protein
LQVNTRYHDDHGVESAKLRQPAEGTAASDRLHATVTSKWPRWSLPGHLLRPVPHATAAPTTAAGGAPICVLLRADRFRSELCDDFDVMTRSTAFCSRALNDRGLSTSRP